MSHVLLFHIKLEWARSPWLEYLYWAKMKLYTFIIQIANKILDQCISLCLYKIGHITKAIICLKFKVIYHAYQGDNSYSENRQFIKKLLSGTNVLFAVIW